VPFLARFAAGVGVATLAGWITFRCRAGRTIHVGPWGLGERFGEVLLVVALTVAIPTLWATALSLLVAIVPLVRTRPRAETVGDAAPR
jgi:hypothetical protein